jgi:hypothetical protein
VVPTLGTIAIRTEPVAGFRHPGADLTAADVGMQDLTPCLRGDHRLGRGSSRHELDNFGDFLWAFVHPAVYGDGEPAARMLRAAADAYGWSGDGLVDSMLAAVRNFQTIVDGHPGAMKWGAAELAYMERNADVFTAALS